MSEFLIDNIFLWLVQDVFVNRGYTFLSVLAVLLICTNLFHYSYKADFIEDFLENENKLICLILLFWLKTNLYDNEMISIFHL
jgi:hypothetical protein